MWVTVRTFDGSQKSIIRDLSKLTKIENLREKIAEVFDAPVDHQQLYYGGKQLVDGHTLFDYNIGFDQTIQLMIRAPIHKTSSSKSVDNESQPKESKADKENNPEESPSRESQNREIATSKYFKVGDLIDAKDKNYGAWFEAKIIRIESAQSKVMQNIKNNHETSLMSPSSSVKKVKDGCDDHLLYTVTFDGYEEEEGPVTFPLKCIRPRARKIIEFEDVSVGDTVMINYNLDDPDERGYWYDSIVKEKKIEGNLKCLIVTLLLGVDNAEFENCNIKFLDKEIFAIEKTIPISERTAESFPVLKPESNLVQKPESNPAPNCKFCQFSSTRKCKECGCHICGKKDDPDNQIMCDECDYAYHIWCLKPPLTSIPKEEDWYCPSCKNDADEVVKPGEKLKESKKRKQMPSSSGNCSRDWGKGMACAGRTKICTLVPPNHFGPIPGVEVGTLWKFRLQVSESGVHRPMVAGISGCSKTGSYSIVLSGGYEDDKDDGEEFTYTGSGGRSLEGNKRTAVQSCNQTLTKLNLALARNCAARVNSNGAEAENWKKGKPVRVVRNYKGHAHSSYCPEEGNRYDGIYKIVKYWPEKGKSGFIVWRYFFRRDDDMPAPWTDKGIQRSEELGLVMQYPPGYLESQAEKEKLKKRKKGQETSDDSDEDIVEKPSTKKAKIHYKLPEEINKLISEDSKNEKLWKECLKHVTEGKIKFLDEVKVQFECLCCQDLVLKPITTECNHNICQSCLKRSFSANVYSCPMCRKDLNKKCVFQINEKLTGILLKLFPGYNTGR